MKVHYLCGDGRTECNRASEGRRTTRVADEVTCKTCAPGVAHLVEGHARHERVRASNALLAATYGGNWITWMLVA